jgi:hypothetical protein
MRIGGKLLDIDEVVAVLSREPGKAPYLEHIHCQINLGKMVLVCSLDAVS